MSKVLDFKKEAIKKKVLTMKTQFGNINELTTELYEKLAQEKEDK